MQSDWFARLFFAVVAAMAVGGRRERHGVHALGPARPDHADDRAALFDLRGREHRQRHDGNGSSDKPYKTLTKAVEVLDVLEVALARLASRCSLVERRLRGGERRKVSDRRAEERDDHRHRTTATGLRRAARSSTESGEDTIFESLVHAPPRPPIRRWRSCRRPASAWATSTSARRNFACRARAHSTPRSTTSGR